MQRPFFPTIQAPAIIDTGRVRRQEDRPPPFVWTVFDIGIEPVDFFLALIPAVGPQSQGVPALRGNHLFKDATGQKHRAEGVKVGVAVSDQPDVTVERSEALHTKGVVQNRSRGGGILAGLPVEVMVEHGLLDAVDAPADAADVDGQLVLVKLARVALALGSRTLLGRKAGAISDVAVPESHRSLLGWPEPRPSTAGRRGVGESEPNIWGCRSSDPYFYCII